MPMTPRLKDLLVRAFRARTLDDLNELETEARAEPTFGEEHEMEGGGALDTHIHIHPPAPHDDDRRRIMRSDRRDDRGRRDDRRDDSRYDRRHDGYDDRRDRRDDARHSFTDPGEGGDMPEGGGGGGDPLDEVMEALRALQDEHEEMMADLEAIKEHCGLDQDTMDRIRDRRRDDRRDDGRDRRDDRRDARRDDRGRRDARYDARRDDGRDRRDDSRRDRRDDGRDRRDDARRDRRDDGRDRRDDRRDARRDDRRHDHGTEVSGGAGNSNASESGANTTNEELLGQLEFEAPKGTGDARKARDSMMLSGIFQDTIAAAEILSPGMRFPTFDAAATPVQTMDCLCQLRRASLTEGLRRSDTKELLTDLLGADDPNRLSIDELSRTFFAAAAAKRRINNASSVSGIGRATADSGFGGGQGVSGRIKTPGDLNTANSRFWESQRTGETQH